MRTRERALRYLKENWGAPFVVAFMVLLVASAAELSEGLSDAANSTAVYAFYSLVIGVALQIASYVKYGEVEREEPIRLEPQEQVVFQWSRRRKMAAAALIVVVMVAGTAFIYPGSHLTVFHQSYPKLSTTVSFANELHEPDGSTVVAFGVNVLGGESPYNFKASWPDNVIQTSTTGIFSRAFLSNQTVLVTANVSVTSADGQRSQIQVSVNSTA
ncbi:MAG: hypothetical protein JRN06_07205 [Nitrososphaerota archaeon]|nr:hypothetical protein [Nitrososphaerota archaeon]MDG7024432.1 hypothetical protein [Nitrososphaerota archaeon]